jgi:hypothetical protein
MLTEQERSQIRSEEIFRLEVIRELEANKPSLAGRKRLWVLLNSSFALWFLSSVVLAGLTAWFANYQSRRNEQTRKAETVQRLDTEIGNRMSQALAGLRIDEQRIKQQPSFPPMAIYGNVVFYLDNSFINVRTNPRDFSIYPDYRGRSFRSLVLELRSLVDPPQRLQLNDAMAGYEEFADLSSIEKKTATDSDQQAEYLAVVAKSHEILNGRLLKERWRSYMQP